VRKNDSGAFRWWQRDVKQRTTTRGLRSDLVGDVDVAGREIEDSGSELESLVVFSLFDGIRSEKTCVVGIDCVFESRRGRCGATGKSPLKEGGS